MVILKWLIVIASVINFGYMSFDGSRGLIVGDYLRPESGEHAGQLGQWSNIVEAIGINPESNTMKTIFLVWGIFGLILAVSFAMEVRGSSKYLLVLSAASLWYLLPGTVLSLVQVILLLIIRSRGKQP